MTRGVKQLEEKVGLILGNYHYSQGMLISILQDIQTEYNYLPREALMEISRV